MKTFDLLIENLTKPALFETGESLWEDEHISKGMLAAHLNPSLDAASRNHPLIDRSAKWISSLLQPESHILDLGCGPGLYAQRLCRMGHTVTGVDISKRSISFAREQAKIENLSIQYQHQNYLTLQENALYDAALMVYCDFGALSPKNRQILLQNVFHILRPGGLFLFDVFSLRHLDQYKERKTWHIAEEGFWHEGKYLCLEGDYLYPEENASVEQYAILTENGVTVYRNWNKAYTEAELAEILSDSGFNLIQCFSDVCGAELTDRSNTLCILAQRRGL